MRYCENCGHRVSDEAKFCAFCGEPLRVIYDDDEDDIEREMVYAGELHKCPNCGEVLSSFMTNCPSCGYEFRDIEVADAVQEFTFKLEQIEAKALKKGLEKQKENEKINLIRNFSVPNTKEDIFEFLVLSSTNINLKNWSLNVAIDPLTEAWIIKLEQVYQKAELLFGDDSDFEKIKRIYVKEEQEIKEPDLKAAMAL